MSQPTARETAPLPYREITGPEFAEQAAATFHIRQAEEGMKTLCGPCPQCGAYIEIPLPDPIRAARATPWATPVQPDHRTSSPKEAEIPVMCTCEEPHPDRPEDAFGCGAYWILDIEEE